MKAIKEERLNDHAFTPHPAGKDKCTFHGCGLPKLTHVWTVGAKYPNPIPYKA